MQMPPPQDDISYLIDPLNDAQREAVCAPPQPMLVLAGAGSGKTRVLIHRIAWLMKVEQVSPHAILAVTFTNKAAAEMKNRLQNLLGIPVSGLWVGTFHGLAHRLLRIHWQEAGLPQAFQILDSDDQYRVIRRTMKALELDEKRWPPKQAQWFINQCKDEGKRAEQLEPGNDLFEQTMQRLYLAYQESCNRSGLVDFAELLLRVYELWQRQPDLLAHYQRRFQHLLIDEFQDTNHIQYEWLRLLAGRQGVMFAVGDDDQSIYGWRGAQVGNLHLFEKQFAPVTRVRLEQNYRSTGNILAAANALISNNEGRLGKELWTADGEGASVKFYAAFNDLEEARFVVERIQAWADAGRSYRDCAVLYRSNAQSRVLEEQLVQAGIPYRVYGGLRFFERAEIKDALAYLRLIANQDDDAAFERVVNTPPRSIGERSVEILRSEARRQGVSLWQAGQQATVNKSLNSRAANAVRRFLELILQLRQAHASGLALHELTAQVLESTGLLAHFQQKKTEKEQMRAENLEELVNATRQYHDGDALESDRLSEFLSLAALEAGEEQSEGKQDGVQLMTLHAAKGLEFPLVFLCGMEEGLFPNARALQDGNLEEERRLCYVGMTRAMQELYLTCAESRRLHGSQNRPRPSRFLYEIPPELLDEIRLRSPRSAYVPPNPQQEGADFYIGQAVRHPQFGDGIVLDSEGDGITARVLVNFVEAGEKWLILSYAKLSPA